MYVSNTGNSVEEKESTVLSIIIIFKDIKAKQIMESDVWLTVHRNSVWIRKTN